MFHSITSQKIETERNVFLEKMVIFTSTQEKEIQDFRLGNKKDELLLKRKLKKENFNLHGCDQIGIKQNLAKKIRESLWALRMKNNLELEIIMKRHKDERAYLIVCTIEDL